MSAIATIEPASVCPNYAAWITPTKVAANLGVSYLVALSWVTRGVRIDRQRVRLRAVKLSGTWRVDPAAVEPFVRRMTAAALGEGADVAPPPESARSKRRRREAGLARMRAAGVPIGGGPEALTIPQKTQGGRRRV